MFFMYRPCFKHLMCIYEKFKRLLQHNGRSATKACFNKKNLNMKWFAFKNVQNEITLQILSITQSRLVGVKTVKTATHKNLMLPQFNLPIKALSANLTGCIKTLIAIATLIGAILSFIR